MVSLITIFGLLGNITTGLVYLAPANTFWYIVRRRSTEEFDCLPYVVKLLNGYMWVYYGVVKPDSILVATINGFGSVLELIYVTIFIIFAPPRMRAITAMLFVVFPIGAVLVTQMSCNREMQINKTVVTTKSVEYMPFLLSLILFINGLVWTVYAVLTNDWFIGIPNGSGFVLGTAQMVLYAMYWKPNYQRQHASMLMMDANMRASCQILRERENQRKNGFFHNPKIRLFIKSHRPFPPRITIFRLQTIGHENNKPTAYEVLKDFDFPIGLLPKGVIGYGFDSSSGKFSAFLNGSCSFSLEGSYRLKYKNTIKGYLSKGRISSLDGVSVKLWFMWVNIVEVSRRGDDLEFLRDRLRFRLVIGKILSFLNGSCSFSLEGSYRLKYKNTIKGYLSKGRISSLDGVSVKLWFMWVNIVEVSRRGDDLEFSVGIAGADFPV
ncbi:cinnamoyl-CoA reductase 2-like [Hibiscus syriacus]|uniref:Cinnamoyl-CoA reductase 2-like n=1 Tax=Hibiscus syriacus TaxID=106335 RepID=A0A6A2YXD8_HIBSY|nr:cinnamoyl-CoA reductase 2-like [Hibiscus syriacus]